MMTTSATEAAHPATISSRRGIRLARNGAPAESAPSAAPPRSRKAWCRCRSTRGWRRRWLEKHRDHADERQRPEHHAHAYDRSPEQDVAGAPRP